MYQNRVSEQQYCTRRSRERGARNTVVVGESSEVVRTARFWQVAYLEARHPLCGENQGMEGPSPRLDLFS